jgi:hypothetical protein
MVFVADIPPKGGTAHLSAKIQGRIKELQANTQNKNPRQKKLPEAK